ncbi:MAG: immunity 26/phosphotriesterase HocA family protein [Sphingobacterium sp.]|jgi:hypothetical protein|nr:immunity 26/phosphotriesterase HocA family protein [Sphingobacterium sp.]
MPQIPFLLTNEQRRYLGITAVEDSWELVAFSDCYLYYDNDTIVKQITVSSDSYYERDLLEETTENRTILLPKTAKGKPKKLNHSAMSSFKGTGVYFSFSSTYLAISNYTTQTTFFDQRFEDGDLHFLKEWLDNWVKESSATDLQEITAFKNATRLNCKYKEGDFFSFRVGRREWGFGRILLDVSKLLKEKGRREAKNYGLANMMGKPLIVKVYHKISRTPVADLDELSKEKALPSQAIMDNHFFYGQNAIIGHRALDIAELDMLISYGQSIDYEDRDCVYVQYGLIFKETSIAQYNNFLSIEGKDNSDNPYTNDGIGFGLELEYLQACIGDNSNNPYWLDTENYASKYDLRNPLNKSIKEEVFKVFGLDPDGSYADNLVLVQTS